MAETETTAKFLESPLLNDAEPSAAWSIDELGAAAAAEMAVLVNGERSVTARYWRLGRLLSLARKPLTHGQWGGFLKQWQIDKTRSAKAMRIFKRFATAEATAGITVAEACERRKKPKSRRKPSSKSEKVSTGDVSTAPSLIQSWSRFTDMMIGVVERQLEEPEFLTPDEATAALSSLGRLLATLHQCEERLRRRSIGEAAA